MSDDPTEIDTVDLVAIATKLDAAAAVVRLEQIEHAKHETRAKVSAELVRAMEDLRSTRSDDRLHLPIPAHTFFFRFMPRGISCTVRLLFSVADECIESGAFSRAEWESTVVQESIPTKDEAIESFAVRAMAQTENVRHQAIAEYAAIVDGTMESV